MPKDMNYPIVADEKKGEILYDWDEDHIHQYRHPRTPWYVQIQRVKDNAATAFITFHDYFTTLAIAIPKNVRLRDDISEKDVPKWPYGDCFRINPFITYTMLFKVFVPYLQMSTRMPPYFSIITPAPDVTYTFLRRTKAEDKQHWEFASSSNKTPEEIEEENRKKLELLMAEPHWDTLEETFPKKDPLPLIKHHPERRPKSLFTF